MKTPPVSTRKAIKDIRPNPRNPRLIKDEKFRLLVKSLQDFPDMLELRPIVIDETGMVLGGNMRLKAAQQLGWLEVPTMMATGMTEEQKREFVIKDNASFGEWDWSELTASWDSVLLADWGVDFPEDAPTRPEAVEDAYDIPETITTGIRPGDTLTIGPHVLVCGDARDPVDWKKLMGGHTADAVITDPPYGVSYAGAPNPAAKEWGPISNDDLRGKELIDFLTAAFTNARSNTKAAAAFYVWYASRTHIQFETALHKAGLEVRQQLIWNKGMVLGQSDYHWAHEPILYCKRSDGPTPPWYGDRTNKTILGQKRTELTSLKKEDLIQIVKNLLDTSTNWEINRDAVVTYKHPTQKPVPLMGRAISNSSPEGGIVADPFIGSGTTMVAAHQLGRRCYAMELTKENCQIVVGRMRALVPGIEVRKNGELYSE